MKALKIFSLVLVGVLGSMTINARPIDETNPTSTFAVCDPGTPVTVNGSRCGTGSVLLSVSSTIPTGFFLRFFDATGNTVIYTSDGGNNWTTPVLSTTTSYMVAYYKNSGTSECTGPKASITAFINSPPSSNAGPDQTGASTCGLTATALAGSPSSGGTWSVISGSGGSFSNSSSGTSTFFGTPGVAYTLRWSVTSGGCVGTDDVNITLNQNPTTPNAGPDQIICSGTTATISANAPSVGTGVWSVAGDSYPAGGSISPTTSNVATLSGVVGGNYGAVWTITNGICSLSDEATVGFRTPPTADAGPDQSTCGVSTVTLAGNAPSGGSGSWSVFIGSGGSFSNASSNTSTFTGVPGTRYTLMWTVSVAGCSAVTDKVVIDLGATPNTANAGPDRTGAATCGLTSVTLAANTAATGTTGTWSIVSGTGGSFTNASSPTSTFSGNTGFTYTLRWTIAGGGSCTPSTDDVIISFTQMPNTANAGADISVCNATTVTLAGNAPVAASGNWTIVTGTGGSFGNSSSATSTFTGTAGSTYTLRWTISNSQCTPTSDDVVVSLTQVSTSNAGPDQTGAGTCGLTSVTLAATAPTFGTGAWSVLSGSGGSFGNTSLANSSFTGTVGTAYTLRWTVTNNGCVSTDDVNITLNQNPTTPNAGADQFICSGVRANLSANTPTTGTGSWSVAGDSYPAGGSISPVTSPTAMLTGVVGGTYGAIWTITNGPCSLSDEAVIIIPAAPTVANAGPDQSLCNTTTATLAGNVNTVGSGTWSVVSGSGGSFSNSSNYNSTFSGVINTTYTLRWSISNGCTPSTDDVVITFSSPSVATGGPDIINACLPSATVNLQGTATPGTGNWTIISGSGGSLTNANSPTAQFSGVFGTTYNLRWTVTNGACAAATDDVQVSMLAKPDVTVTAPASLSFCSGGTATFNATSSFGTASFNWVISSDNAVVPDGLLIGSSITRILTSADIVHDGTVTFSAYSNSQGCQSDAATGTVTILNKPNDPTPAEKVFYPNVASTFEVDAPAGATTRWFNAATGGTLLGTGNTYAVPASSTAPTLYVSFLNGNGCETNRVAVTTVSPQVFNPASVLVETVRVVGTTSDASINGLTSPNQRSAVVSYMDGLSRTLQTIGLKSSPAGNDVVAPVEYDSYGRSSTNYLPYTRNLTNTTFNYYTGYSVPNYQSTFKTDQLAFYNTSGDKVADDASPFVKSVYETSPMGRILEQGKPGADMQPGTGHTNRIAYSLNYASEGDDVPLFVNPFVVGSAVSTQSRANYSLARTTFTDENNHNEIVFTDYAGHTILRKKQLDGTINSQSVDYLRTAYVYNENGQVTYIITPGGYAALQANNWVLTQAILDGHIYQFVYDNRGRVTQKKVPGQAWIYYAYDKLNRLVLVQDANTRGTNKWAFIKYDQQGRAVMTGLYTNAAQTTLAGVQSILDGLYSTGVWYETKGTTLMGYTNQSFPTQNADATALDVYTVNYYDNYDFDNNGTADYTYRGSHLSGLPSSAKSSVVGLATGSKRKILGTSNWLVAASFYDSYGRVIQGFGNNHLNLTVADTVSVAYDFEGKVIASKNFHNGGGTNQVTVLQTPVYNTMNMPTSVQHSINGAPNTVLARYAFNELGQVVTKQLHNTGGSNFLQNVDYRYNINGWLSSINNGSLTNDGGVTNADTTDYFGLELLYNVVDAGLSNNSYYNGNVSAVKWRNVGGKMGATGQKSYNFAYDKTDKLLSATFKKYGTTAWDADVSTVDETIGYDHNGNILNLTRKRKDPVAGTAQSMDVLSYIYSSGNLLSKVDDSSGIADGFNDGASVATEYTYDNNGNVTADANKGMSAITYNALGKPQQVTFTDGRTVAYTYDGTGNKLTMTVTVGSTTTATAYVNGFVYTNGTLDFFASPEGRVKKNGSAYEYQYVIKDHQGNTRILFTSAIPTAQTVTATYEPAAQATEAGYFNNYPSSSGINPVATNNHTAGGSKSQYLSGGMNGQVGVSKYYKVFPGDLLKIEAYARYSANSGSSNLAAFATALLGAFNLSAPVVGETGTASSALNSWGSLAAGGYGDGSTDSADPKAFVNILLFDKNYQFLDVAYSQVTSSGSPAYLSASYKVREAGYAFVYISNENPTLVDVYFDDVSMTYTPTNVLQSNEYYPFGLQTAASWTRDGNQNNFLYNEGSELNATSGLYDLPYRNYDASLGRFFQVDPMATADHTTSPFAYAGGNPVNMNDPRGLMADATGLSGSQLRSIYRTYGGSYYSSFDDWAADNIGGGGGGGGMPNGGTDIGDGGKQSSTGSMIADLEKVKNGTMSKDAFINTWATHLGGGPQGMNALKAIMSANPGIDGSASFSFVDGNGQSYSGQAFFQGSNIIYAYYASAYNEGHGGWVATGPTETEERQSDGRGRLSRLDDHGIGFIMSMAETGFVAGANDLGLLGAFDKGFMTSYRASSRALSTYTRGAVTTLRTGTKALGTAGLIVGAGLATYNMATGNGQLSDAADILMIGGSAVVLGFVGVTAAPFVAAGGLIYGGFMLFGGADLINNSDLGRATSEFLKF